LRAFFHFGFYKCDALLDFACVIKTINIPNFHLFGNLTASKERAFTVLLQSFAVLIQRITPKTVAFFRRRHSLKVWTVSKTREQFDSCIIKLLSRLIVFTECFSKNFSLSCG
jgi:hypothetical protein